MVYLDTRGLAERWQCSPRKIEKLRQSGMGPTYVKLGAQVLYDVGVIEAYEAAHTIGSTSEDAGGAAS